jgi:predicted dehydrogenase
VFIVAQKIRWGILSTAKIAEGQLIPAIKESNNSVVTAVGSRDLQRAKAYAERNDIPKAYGSYEELIADPEVDAIYNPLPNGMHGEWSIRSAESGKPVLCEKPLSSNAAEAQQMADTFKKYNLPLAEAFMYRFHPQTQRVKQMVESGAVGKVHLMEASFSFAMEGDSDIRLQADLAGGALMDVGCYCVSVIRFMLGEEPDQARMFGDFGARSHVDEQMVGLLSFPSGVLAHFDCSMRTHFTQTYRIRGTHGAISVEKAYVPYRPDPAVPTYIQYWKSTPGVEKHQYEEIKIEPVNQYVLMVEDFGDSIINKRPPRFPIEDSIAQMRAIDMLYAAAKQ